MVNVTDEPRGRVSIIDFGPEKPLIPSKSIFRSDKFILVVASWDLSFRKVKLSKGCEYKAALWSL